MDSSQKARLIENMVIDTCPYCGKKEVNLRFNEDTWKLEHVCDNPDCPIGVLPLLIVDNEVYRYLPSIVVSTIDKMAMLGTTNEFRMLFGQAKTKCDIHGFSSGSKCLCSACNNKSSLKPVRMLKDPVPRATPLLSMIHQKSRV